MISFGEYGDGTLNRLDRLDREAAAKEEAETVKREVRQESWRHRKHAFIDEAWFPNRCALCDVRKQDHGWVE
jgi:hypothetical protein